MVRPSESLDEAAPSTFVRPCARDRARGDHNVPSCSKDAEPCESRSDCGVAYREECSRMARFCNEVESTLLRGGRAGFLFMVQPNASSPRSICVWLSATSPGLLIDNSRASRLVSMVSRWWYAVLESVEDMTRGTGAASGTTQAMWELLSRTLIVWKSGSFRWDNEPRYVPNSPQRKYFSQLDFFSSH